MSYVDGTGKFFPYHHFPHSYVTFTLPVFKLSVFNMAVFSTHLNTPDQQQSICISLRLNIPRSL